VLLDAVAPPAPPCSYGTEHVNNSEWLFAVYTFCFLGTHTGNALEYVLENMFTSSENRRDVQDFVFVVTDGISTDDVVDPARRLREYGATVSYSFLFDYFYLCIITSFSFIFPLECLYEIDSRF